MFFLYKGPPPKDSAGNVKLVKSVFGNEITLDAAVIKHILKRHPEIGKLRNIEEAISRTIASPDFVFEGRYGETIAARRIKEEAFEGAWMMVPYEEGGRVKTTFIVSNIKKMIRRRAVLWKRK